MLEEAQADRAERAGPQRAARRPDPAAGGRPRTGRAAGPHSRDGVGGAGHRALRAGAGPGRGAGGRGGTRPRPLRRSVRRRRRPGCRQRAVDPRTRRARAGSGSGRPPRRRSPDLEGQGGRGDRRAARATRADRRRAEPGRRPRGRPRGGAGRRRGADPGTHRRRLRAQHPAHGARRHAAGRCRGRRARRPRGASDRAAVRGPDVRGRGRGAAHRRTAHGCRLGGPPGAGRGARAGE